MRGQETAVGLLFAQCATQHGDLGGMLDIRSLCGVRDSVMYISVPAGFHVNYSVMVLRDSSVARAPNQPDLIITNGLI